VLGDRKVLIIGAGLAGVETAYLLAEAGVKVILCESKKLKRNEAQKLDTVAELVCSNSLKSLKEESAHGLLKKEMEDFGSLMMRVGLETQVPAGDALAVDRVLFSQKIEEIIKSHPLIELKELEVEKPLDLMKVEGADFLVLSTGPMSGKSITDFICQELWDQEKGQDAFFFYDAIAPIVDAETLNYERLYYKDRHQEKEGGDYLNVPFTREEYDHFVEDILAAKKVHSHDFEEEKFFESCLPIDVMAKRGHHTLRYSCMKPIGLFPVNWTEKPYAVLQLRKENLLGSAFNLVGFQTRLTYPEQKRIFQKMPGFENAEFITYGSVHRNFFVNAPLVLRSDLAAQKNDSIYLAGQITGVEGYTESAAMGIYVGLQILRRLQKKESLTLPPETAMGALINYLMTMERAAPSNCHWGIFPQLPNAPRGRKKRKEKKQMLFDRAREAFIKFREEVGV